MRRLFKGKKDKGGGPPERYEIAEEKNCSTRNCLEVVIIIAL